MKNLHKILAFCLIIVVIFTLFSGCDSTKDAYIYLELTQPPITLDPQTASDDNELIIIKNIYEGLLRKNSEGKIVNGACESYTNKGLTYTFNIREDAKWHNGEDLTAFDFVFGIKRAVNPETKAPFASRLFAIKNAKEIYNGTKDLDSLGVKALDKKTLVIELSYKDDNFLNVLTTSVAMPCNEKFFNQSDGKYGLFKDYVFSNSSYKLTKWNKESFGIRLYRNEEYNGEFYSQNAAVFISCRTDKPVIERLKESSIDIAFVNCAYSSELNNSGVKTAQIENICWFLTLGNNFSPNMRKSLSMLVGSEIYANNLKDGFSPANSIFPSVISDSPIVDGKTLYNLESGKKLFLQEVSKTDKNKFPEDIILYYYDDGNIKSVVTDIVGHWQNNLSAFVNIESVSDSQLLADEIVNQKYPMAIFPIVADNSNTYEYLKKLGIDYKGESLSEIQSKFLKSNNIIPIAFQNTTIAYSPAITNLITQAGDGYVDLSFIVKDE